jgi:hypothetical protein
MAAARPRPRSNSLDGPDTMRSPSSFAALACAATLAWAAPAAADITVFEAPSFGDFRLDLYGWVQPRFTYQQNDDRPQVNFDPTPAFTVERARMGTIALLGPWARAQVEVDFSGEFAQPIDAYINLSPVHEKMVSLNLMAGQFRVPISRQNLLPSVGYQFADVAYFVAPQFLIDRNIGAKLWADLFEQKLRLEVGMYNSNDPGPGQKINSDPYFMYGARIEVNPFGPAPRFEGDLRPLGAQYHPILAIGASVMQDKLVSKQFNRYWAGGDLAAYWEGASLYAEVFYHVDQGFAVPTAPAPANVRQLGGNVQVGYFPPLPWVREHLEPVFRWEYFDPAMDVQHPNNDPGSRDLTGTNPTWGYMGFVLGLNYFLNHKHTVKAQVSYEIRNETKQCLQGQSLAMNNCTGYIANNLFVAQITTGF